MLDALELDSAMGQLLGLRLDQPAAAAGVGNDEHRQDEQQDERDERCRGPCADTEGAFHQNA